MKTYYYGYETAEGTRNMHPYEETDKRRAAQEAREMADGNCLIGSSATWYVKDEDGDIVASGWIKG